jgi:hypothetical protein
MLRSFLMGISTAWDAAISRGMGIVSEALTRLEAAVAVDLAARLVDLALAPVEETLDISRLLWLVAL